MKNVNIVDLIIMIMEDIGIYAINAKLDIKKILMKFVD